MSIETLSIDPTVAVLFLAAGALFFVAAIVALAGMRSYHKRIRRKLATVEQLANSALMDVKTVVRGSDHLEQEIRANREQINMVRERQGQLELRGSGSHMYEQAIRMVREGFDVEQIMSCCGLSRGEAALVVQLHGSRAA